MANMGTLKNAVKRAVRPYYYVKSRYPVWRAMNVDGILLQKLAPLPLDAVGERIVRDLRRDGISIIDIDELFPGEGMLEKLKAHLTTLAPSETALSDKYFYRDYWDMNRFLLDFRNPFLAFSMRDRFLAIVNEYLGMYARLHSLRLMKTIKVPDGKAPEQSQLWHRDGGSVKYVKIFLYLNDVTRETGPFYYLKGSQPGGKWAHLFPHPLPYTPGETRTTDADLLKHVPESDVVECVGKAGTLVFTDTVGLHKGGFSVGEERITLLSTFFSRSSLTKLKKRKKFIFPADFNAQISKLSRPAYFAVKRAPFWR